MTSFRKIWFHFTMMMFVTAVVITVAKWKAHGRQQAERSRIESFGTNYIRWTNGWGDIVITRVISMGDSITFHGASNQNPQILGQTNLTVEQWIEKLKNANLAPRTNGQVQP